MVQGGRPCKGALGLVLFAVPEQENEYISLRPSNFIDAYFIRCVMDVNLDAALTGAHGGSVTKVMHKNIAHLIFVYTYSLCRFYILLFYTYTTVRPLGF